ncbi:MAG: hypothetical protein ACTHNW_04055 [Mucilaginibacter sp.]
MKALFTLFAFSLFAFTLHAQSVRCAKFKNGKFKTILSNGSPAIIIRQGKRQFENAIVGKDTIKAEFTINWVDECTYTLAPDSITLKRYPKLPKNYLVTVKMSNIKPNSYTQTSTANISNKIFTSEMVLMPNN